MKPTASQNGINSHSFYGQTRQSNESQGWSPLSLLRSTLFGEIVPKTVEHFIKLEYPYFLTIMEKLELHEVIGARFEHSVCHEDRMGGDWGLWGEK